MMVEELIRAYNGGASIRQCADLFGLERRKVRALLAESGVTIRGRIESMDQRHASAPWRDRTVLLSMYQDKGMSTLEIAAVLSCDKSVVVDWLNRFGAKMRTTAETQIGKAPGNAGKGKRNSSELVPCGCGCGALIKRFNPGSNEVRFARGHRIKGASHPLYKPHSQRNEKRMGSDYREWRKAVLVRADYTCRCCGARGGTLQAHHLDNYADHPDRRFDVENGVALCPPCHRSFHRIYGQRSKTTAAQFHEFLVGVN